MAKTLEDFDFSQTIGRAEVTLQPLGVAAAITPWNSNYGFICGKLATAIAAGCTMVVKPSEMSASQTDVLMRALHEAGLPPGVFNIVNGRGEVVGGELSAHPDVAKISFTGSTAVGRAILRAASDTFASVFSSSSGRPSSSFSWPISTRIFLRALSLRTCFHQRNWNAWLKLTS